MNKLEVIDYIINELQGLAITDDETQSEQYLTNVVDMFEPLLLACAAEFKWEVSGSGPIS